MSSVRYNSLFIIICCLLGCAGDVLAQFEGVDNEEYINRVISKNKIFDLETLIWQRDSFKMYEITSALRKYAIEKQDKIQKFNADFGEIAYMIVHYDRQAFREQDIAYLKNLIQREEDNGNLVQAITARRFLANYYWEYIKNYELAFEAYLQIDQILTNSAEISDAEKSANYYAIGKAYLYFKDYRRALSYFKKVPPQSPDSIPVEETFYRHALNFQTLCWQGLHMPDSAELCLHALIDYSLGIKDTAWYGIACGYMGHNYVLKKNYSEAIQYLETGIQIATKEKDTGWIMQQKLWLADVYFQRDDPDAAFPLVQWCRQFRDANRSQPKQNLNKLLFPLIARMYSYKGDLSKVNTYIDSAIWMTNELNQEFSSLIVARIQQNQFLTHAQKIEADKNAKIQERNRLLGFIFILFFLSIYTYRLNRHKHLQEQQLEESLIQEQQMELNQSLEKLEAFTKMITEKNKMIEAIQSQFEKSSGNEYISTLQKSTILSQEDWDIFKALFEKVHTGYLERLEAKFPSLSLAETRFMVLAKLKFTNKEMAYTLGVSADSMRVTWHRLRKKLNLPKEIKLAELVASI